MFLKTGKYRGNENPVDNTICKQNLRLKEKNNFILVSFKWKKKIFKKILLKLTSVEVFFM